MWFSFGRISLLFCAIWISVCRADDIVMQLFANRPINYVSDKYISFSMSPADLVDIYNDKRNAFTLKMRELGPSHLKISGHSMNQSEMNTHLMEMNASKINLGEWLYEATKSHGLKLVVPLPYDPKKWNPRDVIKMLGKFTTIDMNEVIWQLGSDFHATDAMKYIDDLSTLRTIVDAFATRNKNQSWTVAGSDLTVGSNVNEARLYSELSQHIVSAIGWSQSSESLHPEEGIEDIFAPLNIDPALRTILNSRVPVWLSLTHLNHEMTSPHSTCLMACITKGLKWAQTLGDASRNGFKMIYTPIDQHEWFKPSLTYYTTLLHKRLMGETVLDTKIMNGNRFDAHVYSHCARDMSGAFTIYGVNSADTSARVLAKMPPMRAGTEYSEYVLTVRNGIVQLNGNDIIEGMQLSPAIKTKRFNKPAFLSLPAKSVGFWVFSKAKLTECERTHDDDHVDHSTWGRTSSEQLLQELISDEIERENEMEKNLIEKSTSVKRERRNIHNGIEKEHKLNAIKKNVNIDENEIHKRNRRSIDDDISAARLRRAGNLMNMIYSEMDLMKRRQIHSPFSAKMDVAMSSKRSKRHINALTRLLEKFEFKKPTFNFKPPPFKLSAGAIPPITAVHDIYAVNSAERKVFNSVENPELPAGDIHFHVEEPQIIEQTGANIAYNGAQNAPIVGNVQAAPPLVNEPMNREVATADLNVQDPAELYYESLFGDAPLPQTPPPPPPPPPQHFNAAAPPAVVEQQPARFDELWEIDAAQFRPMPSLASKQSTQAQEPTINQNIDFVVKELQPTWQKNQENLQKARNTLQKFYAPSIGTSKISSMLSNVARPQNIQSPFFDSAERRFFETRRRRRRSIDARMNDEIEKRIQQVSSGQHPNAKDSADYNDLDDAIEKLSVLERALKIVTEIDHKQNPSQQTDFSKMVADLEKLGDIVAQNIGNTPKPFTAADDNLQQKRCKILSKSMEQRCLREPSNPIVAFFKREMSEDKTKKPTGPLKKLLATVKENQRHKRSLADVIERIEAKKANDIHLNEISRDLFSEAKPIGIGFMKKPYARRDAKPMHEKIYNSVSDKTQEYMPKFFRVVKRSVNQVLDTITSHLSGLLQSFS